MGETLDVKQFQSNCVNCTDPFENWSRFFPRSWYPIAFGVGNTVSHFYGIDINYDESYWQSILIFTSSHCGLPWLLSWQRIHLQCRRPWVILGSGRSAGEGIGYKLVFLGSPGGSAGKEPACNAGDLGLIPGLWRTPGEGKDYPLQYSGLENSMDCIVPGVANSQTRLSDFHFHFSLSFHGSQLFIVSNSSRSDVFGYFIKDLYN